MKFMMQVLPFALQSKHVVCSPDFLELLLNVLGTPQPARHGSLNYRAQFNKKRAKEVNRVHVAELPDCPRLTDCLDLTDTNEIDDTLMDYMGSPPRVQMQELEEWDRAWSVIKMNDRNLVSSEGHCLKCVLCEDPFDMFHLCFSGCTEQIKEQARDMSFLSAITDHVIKNRPKVYSVNDVPKNYL